MPIFLGTIIFYTIFYTNATLIPGPIAVVIVTDLIYFPFAAAGLAFIIASIKTSKFSWSFSFPNDFLPITKCATFPLSNLYSTLPDLIYLTAFSMSIVIVPDFGFGINPLGPNSLPILPIIPIMSGVVTITS